MKKIILFIVVIVALFSNACNKDFDTLNDDPKKPSEIAPDFLFAGAQRQMSDLMTNSNVNFNIFRLISQHWTQTTYIDESNYDLETRNIPQNFWNGIYIDVIKSLSDCKSQIPKQNTALVPAGVQKNQTACADIMIVYAYSILVSTFGDIPYSEAIDIDKVYPAYEKQADVFPKLIARLDDNLSKLDESQAAFGGNDLLLGGDIKSWKVFANSIKLRLGMMIADANPTLAKTTVAAAAPNAISGGAIAFHYLSSPPNTNPVWVDLVQSNRKDFVACASLVEKMTELKDPRMATYFTLDAKGSYSGGKAGAGNNYSTYSKPGGAITAQAAESVVTDDVETNFLLAEAVERGFITGTASTYYNKAITASIEAWGGSAAQATAYLAQPKVAYATATGTWKEKIGDQKWIALYNRGYETWTEIRRLDAPKLDAPEEAVSDFPVRYTYPVQEQNLNKANYERAATSIGGDEVKTKLYWDKF